jgi:hypothetical protein
MKTVTIEPPPTNGAAPEAMASSSVPTHIDPADLAYHAHVFEKVNLIPGLRESIERLQRTISVIEGSRISWTAYQCEKHGLDPTTTAFEPDGGIVHLGREG